MSRFIIVVVEELDGKKLPNKLLQLNEGTDRARTFMTDLKDEANDMAFECCEDDRVKNNKRGLISNPHPNTWTFSGKKDSLAYDVSYSVHDIDQKGIV